MKSTRFVLIIFILLLMAGIGGFLLRRQKSGRGIAPRTERIAAVAVAPITHHSLDLERTFSGALEASAQFMVASKVAGRIERLEVDLADPVERGEIVAKLDDAEFIQAMKQAEAELAVAQANLAQAQSALEITRRQNQRVLALRERGIASDEESDLAQGELQVKEAQHKIADAEVSRAAAALESARIRYGYTQITADWSETDQQRRVSERFVDAGETVSANKPLLQLVALDPIVAVITVTERDYGRMQPGLDARIETDSFPGEIFDGKIVRIAPVFRETSRQARIEINLANSDARLKPGMFIRATITLDHVNNATVVPDTALTERGDKDGVFLVNADRKTVIWKTVKVGIQADGWVQLLDENLSGEVVTLGQHLLDDGSAIQIAEKMESNTPP